MSAWATEAETLAKTGVTVTATDISMAQSAIEIYANRSYDATDGMSARDVYWLKTAVCWQAAWLNSQVAFAQKSQANSISQLNMTVQRQNEYDVALAPLAARALKNLSWKGTRAMRVKPEAVPRGADGFIDYLAEASDDMSEWDPI